MELGWWPQLGLTFLQLLLISSLPRGTVGRIQEPPGGDFCLLGLAGGQERGVPREGACVSLGGGGELSSSANLGGLASGAEVSLFLSKNVTPFFCHPNLWD